MRQVKTEAGTLTYELCRKRVKNLNLRVRADGSIAVSAPAGVTVAAVDEFVRRKAGWIAQVEQKLADRRLPDPEYGALLGHRVPLVVEPGPPGVWPRQGALYILSLIPISLSLLAQGAGQGGFYLSHSELRLYLPTDLIAPRAAGFPECSISYAENDCFRVDIPRVDLDAQPLKTAMKEIYEQVVPLLPEEERTDVRMVSDGEGEVEGEAVSIVQLYLPEGQVIGYYAVGQQSGALYPRDDQGVFQPWEP